MPTPSRLRVALQAARRTQLAGRRLAAWALQPGRWTRPVLAPPAEAFAHDLYDVRVPLLRRDPAADPRLEAGKRVNVALAACAFDGLLLTPAQPLSFWRTLGRVTPEAGFQLGMELRGGCIVPTVGGGVCLLSNALFAMAARLGWAVLERHGHSLEAVPPTDGGPWGLDATVLWPHVDLRVAPRVGRVRLGVTIDGDTLRLSARGDTAPAGHIELAAVDDARTGEVRTNRIVRRTYDAAGRLVAEDCVAVNAKRVLHQEAQRRTCLTCGEVACARRPRGLPVVP